MSDLNVIDSDRQFAADILEDMGNFEEGITDLEKLAQWVRNVRHAAEKKVSAQPQSPSEHGSWRSPPDERGAK